MKEKINLSQKLFRLLASNRIQEVEVTSIDKKFFYVDNELAYPINIQSLLYINKNYPQFNFQVHLSKEEIKVEYSRRDLIKLVRSSFDYSSNTDKFTLDQLQEVCNILKLK